MVSYGYTLSSEEHSPRSLVGAAARAEEAGFEFVSISDHFHPWTTSQGHSPFVWSVLGAVAGATDEIGLAVGVTCPIVRIHPVIVAQAAATTALLSDGRFTFGVGTGEALNEHVLGHRWPPIETRLAMLTEAVTVIRRLWTGETVDHRGDFYEVANARLFDPPDPPPPIVVSGFGEAAVELAGEIGDGYWGHAPDADVLHRWRMAGGNGPTYAQLHVCVAPDRATARRTVRDVWPNAAIPGQLAQDLPTWTHFEQAAELVDEEAAVASIPHGPDADDIVAAVERYVAAGYDHVYLHQIGSDQDALFDLWRSELRDALADIAPPAAAA
ncbi:MAG: TIGR03557 family F420-dependent LLM class oxidoreductase [Acidimicrobiales bacterium]|nr:TIGR03557 family F420-dependent LLM class oxidoreductase [Acidimicrobiales bacterium]MCB1248253.1 TIGR03557 family F420-dependent LLM class oxidoreductase [Acidimicrobiales bacterium]MCB1261688.1 TIGR03557 family F420-dependent LLM class oxidoreductase [Acidimicrobiales bacterium]